MLMITGKFQSGSGILEFILVAIPIVFISLGGIELAAWLNLRQSLSLALMNAGRAASSLHAKPEVIAAAFENSLLMAYPKPVNLKRRLDKNKADLGQAWQIKILNPTAATFYDHQSESAHITSIENKQARINNYYQDLQHTNNINKGLINGRGQKSKADIFQANTLQLELIWPQQPITPLIGKIILLLQPLLSKSTSRQQDFYQTVFAAGYLPFKRNISISMHSHPVLWASMPDKRVIYADENYFDTNYPANNFKDLQALKDIICQTQGYNLSCSQKIPDRINTSQENTDANDTKHTNDSTSPSDQGSGETDQYDESQHELEETDNGYCDLVI